MSDAQSKTIESFDFQWRRLPNDRWLLSDEHWRLNVASYILDELSVTADWMKGKNVLDAGCGQGRWAYGFDKLGCHVFGFDTSESGIEYARRAVPNGQFTVAYILDRERLLELYAPEQFDVVWVWGVLHHTGNPTQALANLVPLVAPHGLVHAYVYGEKTRQLHLLRMIMNHLPLLEARVYAAKLMVLWKGGSVHGWFDALSPTIASEHTEYEVRKWFTDAGLVFVRVYQPNWCRGSTDLFVTGRRE
jgi:2-polyprenyl-3-methyl-5-hydroxy-6-metoxy-1,4-benzoquinol methylase